MNFQSDRLALAVVGSAEVYAWIAPGWMPVIFSLWAQMYSVFLLCTLPFISVLRVL